jgi:N-glycosylase/DNA lyase
MIFNLCKRYGDPIEFKGERYYEFPKPETLVKASIRGLRQCKLGYRAETILKTARLVNKGDFDLEALKTMSYERAKEVLLTLPGVGPKVADCILLFSLDKLEAFPIDVWMKRIILEYYSKHFDLAFVKKMKAKKGLSPRDHQAMYAFGRGYFSEYLGYAQEYLYHHKRCQANPERVSTKKL